MTVLKKSITLNPGQSKEVAFSFIPGEARAYQVAVDGLIGSFTAIEAPPYLSVKLKNPPVDPISGFPANKWQMLICDWDRTQGLNWGVIEHDNITQTAIFEIPPDWVFPTRINIGIYYQWQENGEWYARQLYRVQSYREEVFGEPDPDYKPIFIPEPGSYYYNVATERFEKIG